MRTLLRQVLDHDVTILSALACGAKRHVDEIILTKILLALSAQRVVRVWASRKSLSTFVERATCR
jgi:hypothetical protein